MKVHFELMKCINDQLTRAKHASRSAAEASYSYVRCTGVKSWNTVIFKTCVP